MPFHFGCVLFALVCMCVCVKLLSLTLETIYFKVYIQEVLLQGLPTIDRKRRKIGEGKGSIKE